LTYRHIYRMVFHMKTTLSIDDTVMAQLRREAARQGRTMSDLVETALRLLFRARRSAADLPDLPTLRSGGALVDVADREALYQAMEGR
jgi:hypothetical protein